MLFLKSGFLTRMDLLLCKSSVRLFPQSSAFFCKHDVSFSVYFSTKTEKQTVDSVSVSEYLMQKHDFSPESASKIASFRPHLKNTENSDLVISFLKESGFSNPQLEMILKCKPLSLSATLDKAIMPQIKIFQDYGFSPDEISKIVTRYPRVLHCSVDKKIIPSLCLLKDLLGSKEEVAKVLKISAWFLIYNLEKTLLPNIEILKSYGVCGDQIVRFMFYFPRFLLSRPQIMKQLLEKVDEMGVDRTSGAFLYAARVIGCMTSETFNQKMNNFMNLGFSQDDLLTVFRTDPMVFSVSEQKIKNITTVLLQTGKYDLASIVRSPASLVCSVENRYMPRIGVLRVLEKRNLIKNWPALGTLRVLSNEKFVERFVSPYLDQVEEFDAVKKKLLSLSKKKEKAVEGQIVDQNFS